MSKQKKNKNYAAQLPPAFSIAWRAPAEYNSISVNDNFLVKSPDARIFTGYEDELINPHEASNSFVTSPVIFP